MKNGTETREEYEAAAAALVESLDIDEIQDLISLTSRCDENALKSDAKKLQQQFGVHMRIKNMRGTNGGKVIVYVDNAGPSCVLRIGEILTDCLELDAERNQT